MAGLEAAVERIQQLWNLHLVAHHVVNSFLHYNIVPLGRHSFPHWEVLSREHPTRMHQESPSSSKVVTISNFLTGGDQTIEATRHSHAHPAEHYRTRGHLGFNASLR
jgi:hypothetical protein